MKRTFSVNLTTTGGPDSGVRVIDLTGANLSRETVWPEETSKKEESCNWHGWSCEQMGVEVARMVVGSESDRFIVKTSKYARKPRIKRETSA